MRIGLLIDFDGQRVWHRWLATELARHEHELAIYRPAGETGTCPPALRLALWLDPIWYRLSGEHAFDAIQAHEIPERSVGGAESEGILDLLIDMSGDVGRRPPARHHLQLSFPGGRSELAAVAMLLGDDPVKFLLQWLPAGPSESAYPSVLQRACLTAGLDAVLSSVVELLVERVARRLDAPATPDPIPGSRSYQLGEQLPRAENGSGGARHIARLVAAKLAQYLGSRSREPGRWAIATRVATTGGLFDALPATMTYKTIPDDGRRYYADPLLVDRGGRTYMFCEEFPLATKRGIISVAEVDRDGTVGAFGPVLERPYHISYPFVFAYGGQYWMVPESCESGAVELYRAVEFPHRWEFDRKLIEDVRACDATIIHSGEGYWLTLTSTRWLGSTCDKPRIYSALTPLGPWREHPMGLIGIDSTMARPAGPAFRRGGRLVRPVQNCSVLYGGSITLLEIRELSNTGYLEVPIATAQVKSPDSLSGTHTYSALNSIEAVDVWGAVGNLQSVELQSTTISERDTPPNRNLSRVLSNLADATE